MGGVDEDVASTAINQIKSSSFFDVKNVHLKSSNVTLSNVDDVSYLVVIETQVMDWKLHIYMFTCWGFFDMNNAIPMDLVTCKCFNAYYVNLKILQNIIKILYSFYHLYILRKKINLKNRFKVLKISLSSLEYLIFWGRD